MQNNRLVIVIDKSRAGWIALFPEKALWKILLRTAFVYKVKLERNFPAAMKSFVLIWTISGSMALIGAVFNPL